MQRQRSPSHSVTGCIEVRTLRLVLPPSRHPSASTFVLPLARGRDGEKHVLIFKRVTSKNSGVECRLKPMKDL